MSQSRHPFLSILAISAALIAFFVLLFNFGPLQDGDGRRMQAKLMEKNAALRKVNDGLSDQIDGLTEQTMKLKSVLIAYEKQLMALTKASRQCVQSNAMHPAVLPEGISKERFQVRQLYRRMYAEKSRWDQYQQGQYQSVLDSTVEPWCIDSLDMDLEHEGNLSDFLELEQALKLHKRLIRDVRKFHDEVKYQRRQLQTQQPYSLYDLKFELAPFARESALVDAMHQAMSALSAGIYEQEAIAVLERIGSEFTKPIHQLYEQQRVTTKASLEMNYNYNFYTIFGKKLMDYSVNLSRQSAIALGPAAFGELDFFNRQLSESLYDLYLIGLYEAADPDVLDVNELQQLLYSAE